MTSASWFATFYIESAPPHPASLHMNLQCKRMGCTCSRWTAWSQAYKEVGSIPPHAAPLHKFIWRFSSLGLKNVQYFSHLDTCSPPHFCTSTCSSSRRFTNSLSFASTPFHSEGVSQRCTMHDTPLYPAASTATLIFFAPKVHMKEDASCIVQGCDTPSE